MSKNIIWFWQRIVSPHMVGLADALVEQGCEVVYVAQQFMSPDRANQGWAIQSSGKSRIVIAPTIKEVCNLVESSSKDSIHICQGIRGNGLVIGAMKAISKRKLRLWVVMETVDDSGFIGLIKRLEYRRLFFLWRKRIEGVLATGYKTSDWLIHRGVPSKQVFPFAYFLPSFANIKSQQFQKSRPFRFAFVGQFIKRKRLSMLISILNSLNRKDYELVVIGSGPLETKIHFEAEVSLNGQLKWLGRLTMKEVHNNLLNIDCLVLPSRYDGWGAVVSESLMVGTPAICSNTCGCADVVRESGYGGVFNASKPYELRNLLLKTLNKGIIQTEVRASIANWAKTLGAAAGAKYFRELIGYVSELNERPDLPWIKKGTLQ